MTPQELEDKSKALNGAIYTYHDLSGITPKIVSDWTKKGIITDRRTGKGRPWNYFSAIDLVYIGIMQRLKTIGLSHKIMLAAKQMLFEINTASDDKNNFGNLEYSLLELLTYNHPMYFIVAYNEADATGFYLVDEIVYFEMLKTMTLKTYCSVLVNDVVKEKLPPLYREPDYDLLVGLSSEEIEILDLIKKERSISVHITLKDGKVKTIEGTERYVDPKEIAELMQVKAYDTISLKRHGKILAAHRTVRKNFKSKKSNKG